MKLRNISLVALFTALFTRGIQAAENPFAPENNPLPTTATSAPISSHEQIAAPSSLMQAPKEPTNPFAPASPSVTEDHAATSLASHDEPANLEDRAIALAKADENQPSNPFAPKSQAITEPEHHEQTPASLNNHAVTPAQENPFSSEKNSLPKDHTAMTERHEATSPTPPMHQGHISTAEHTASIKTLDITPGHSATLEPIAINHGVETERYFIQDKKYESYLSSHINPTERTYTVTIPATVHVGSFTVFKVQGMHGTPDHLQPAYHVEIQGNVHEVGSGTQYPEPQGSAVEKLTQLEDKYLTGIQTQFKAFTQEVRELISTAHQNGESLEAAKLQATQIIATKKPLQLTIGESHIATSFTGGSAQSSNPTITSAILKFDGTKTDPKWKLILTAHKAGEAIITYSSGAESTLQPVIVVEKSSTLHTSEHTTVLKEAVVSSENSVKPTSKKENRALPAHEADEEEESKEKNDSKSTVETATPAEEEEDSEETDEKTANTFAKEDEPFASFLKEAPGEEATSNDAESSDASTTELEPAQSTATPKKIESASDEAKSPTDDADEEPTEDQEEDK